MHLSNYNYNYLNSYNTCKSIHMHVPLNMKFPYKDPLLLLDYEH